MLFYLFESMGLVLCCLRRLRPPISTRSGTLLPYPTPFRSRGSFQDMTSDSLDTDNECRTLPTAEINYMRNAVKAVVDADDGTVTLYAWDEKDPLLKAWRSAFPGTVKDKKDIPADLLAHMRYPEDMFKVQRYQLAAYHVDKAKIGRAHV